jgi:hypothetical protein
MLRRSYAEKMGQAVVCSTKLLDFNPGVRTGSSAWAELPEFKNDVLVRMCMTAPKDCGGEQFYTDASWPIPLGAVASVGAGEAAMIRILHDLLVFSCLAAFVTGIVLAAASLLI